MKKAQVLYFDSFPKSIKHFFENLDWEIEIDKVDDFDEIKFKESKVCLFCVSDKYKSYSLGMTRFLMEKFNKPLVVLDEAFDLDYKNEVINLGADLYLSKPISLDDLARYIVYYSIKSKGESNVISYKDITLDLNRRMVTRGEKEFSLRNKEFELLKYLVENPGIILSKTQILERVWDLNAFTSTTTVESHMSTLRRKIDKDFSVRRLHTVYCVGYKIE